MYVQTMPFRLGSAVEVRQISVSLRSKELAQGESCWRFVEHTHHSKPATVLASD